MRGHGPTEGMDSQSYFFNVAYEDWEASQRPGFRELRDSVDALGMYIASHDVENQLDELRLMREEIDRQERSLRRQQSVDTRSSRVKKTTRRSK
jgi:hypothetical protein